MMVGCPQCGRKMSNGKQGCLCVECSVGRENTHETQESDNPSYLLTTEMHESNYSRRLAEGFAMMNGDY